MKKHFRKSSGTIQFRLLPLFSVFTCFIIFFLITGFKKTGKEAIISDFRLLSVNGQIVSLSDYPTARGFIIVFTCNHCPFAKLYPERMNDLNIKYAPLGVPLIAISSTDTLTFEDDTYSKMVENASNEHFNFPYLFDGEQTVAKSFKAQKTPHAYIVWKEKEKLVIKCSKA